MAIGTSAALAVGAALCFGLQALVVKAGMDRAGAESDVAPAFGAAVVSVLVSLAVFWGLAARNGLPPAAMRPGRLAPLLGAGVLYPAAFRLLYFTGIDRVGANIAGAVIAANPAVAVLLAVPLLDERFTIAAGIGLLCIVGGGALLQMAQRTSAEGAAATDVIERELAAASVRDVLFPLGAMVSIGVGYVLIKVGLTGFPHPIAATAITQTAGMVVFATVLVASPRSRRQVRVSVEHPPVFGAFVVAGLLVALAWLAQFFALRSGAVVLVIPLINTFPIVIAVGSYALAREVPRSPRVIAGIVAIIVGASVMQSF